MLLTPLVINTHTQLECAFSVMFMLCPVYLDEVCWGDPQQQHDRRPLSRICHSERPHASHGHPWAAQPARRFSHFTLVSGSCPRL